MAKKKERTIDTLETTLEDLELLCGDTQTNKPAEILERVTLKARHRGSIPPGAAA